MQVFVTALCAVSVTATALPPGQVHLAVAAPNTVILDGNRLVDAKARVLAGEAKYVTALGEDHSFSSLPPGYDPCFAECSLFSLHCPSDHANQSIT